MRITAGFFLTVGSVCGQIAFDGSLGPAGPVDSIGGRYTISPAAGREAGGNLFHSFSQFSVPDGTLADFTTGSQTETIIARVTGGEASDIQGRIRSGASLYLLNPEGFVFGENSSLDIDGSFSAISADRIAHADGGFFSATPSGETVLSSAPVSAFGFLGVSPGHVTVNTTLNTNRGNLTLVGRTVNLADTGLVSAGDISIAAAGNVNVEVPVGTEIPVSETLQGRVSATRTVVSSGGGGKTVSIRAGDADLSATRVNFSGFANPAPSSLNVSSTRSVSLSSGTALGANSGSSTALDGIDIRAGTSVSMESSSIVSFATGSATAADISIKAASLSISGTGGETFSGITSSTLSGGKGGETRISVSDNTVIENGGLIAALSLSSGDAGKVSLDTGSLTVTGLSEDGPAQADFLTGISGSAESSGGGGELSVHADEITLLRGGLIDSSTFGSGVGGGVRVEADEILIDRSGSEFFTGIGTDTDSQGNAGTVFVSADRLTLLNGGLISSSTAGAGNAGNITIIAGDFSASGSGRDTGFVFSPGSGVAAGSVDKGLGSPTGRGGSIGIDTTRFILSDKAGVLTRSAGSGDAGDITISGNAFDISGESEVSVFARVADAGSLSINFSGDIAVRDSVITAASGNDGGNISFRSDGLMRFSGSVITADARGNGGNIAFSGARHLVLNRTPVSASAVDRDGGNITVTTGTFFANLSPLSVTSEKGAPGTVNIATLNALAGGEETEEAGLLDPNDVLQPDCNLRQPDVGSSFTKAGRGGTERLPGGFLPSFRIIE